MDEYEMVNVGVDTMWFDICYASDAGIEHEQPGKRLLDEMLIEKLSALQEMTRLQEKPLPTEYSFHDACLLMYGNRGGLKSPWRFILRNAFIEVKLGLGKKNGYIARVHISAEYL